MSDAKAFLDEAHAKGLTGEDFGYRARAEGMAIGHMLGHPEVGPLIRELLDGGIDDQTFQNRLRATNWYKTTAPSVREFDSRQARDPAAVKADIAARAAEVTDLARSLGVTDQGFIYTMSVHSLRFGWSETELRDRLVADIDFKRPRAGAASAVQTVEQLEEDFAVFVPPGRRRAMARRLLEGSIDPDGLRAEFADRAKSLYGDNAGLVNTIERGGSVSDYAAPYVEMTATLLGLADAGSVDLRKPKFRRILQGHKEGRSYTANEWESMVRTRPEYDFAHSAMANEETAADVMGIEEFFHRGVT